jgi:hypothetical protein
MSFGEKRSKGEEKKIENVRKRKKGERKEKMESKRVKQMQSR